MRETDQTQKTPQQIFLQDLKTTTLPQHEALERNAQSAALMRKDLSREKYLDILQRFYGFVVPVEKQIYPLLNGIFGDTDKFKRSNLLHEDLVSMGMSPEAVATLPILTELPAAKNTAGAFGIVYVLEGSKLGGQFISRHLGEVLGLTPDTGMHFFYGYGKETGAMWNQFRHAMADYAVTSGEQQDIINTASQTFDAFNFWLDHT